MIFVESSNDRGLPLPGLIWLRQFYLIHPDPAPPPVAPPAWRRTASARASHLTPGQLNASCFVFLFPKYTSGNQKERTNYMCIYIYMYTHTLYRVAFIFKWKIIHRILAKRREDSPLPGTGLPLSRDILGDFMCFSTMIWYDLGLSSSENGVPQARWMV